MANSFEPLLPDAEGLAQGGGGWLAALSGRGGFTPDPRFRTASTPTAAHPATARDTALAQAYAQGEAAGHAAALAQVAQEGAARRGLALELASLDGTLRDRLTERLAETVAALCEATLLPLALDREALQQRCITAACAVGEGIIDASLRLNPDDIDLLDPDFAATWHIVPDADLERGTVVFDMPEGAVRDGPQEWRTAMREALGLC